MPKTEEEERALETYLKKKSVSDSVWLGMQKYGNYWKWEDGNIVFSHLVNQTDTPTTTQGALWDGTNYLAKLGVDGRIDAASRVLSRLNQAWIAVKFPEPIIVRQVKVRVYFNSDYFKTIHVRVGDTELADNAATTLDVNTLCVRRRASVTDDTEVVLKCQEPGIQGTVVTIQNTDYHLSLLEIQALDCPNTFVYLNNRCYHYRTPALVSSHQVNCNRRRSSILAYVKDDPVNVRVFRDMLGLYDQNVVYSGYRRSIDGNWFSSHDNKTLLNLPWEPEVFAPSWSNYAYITLLADGSVQWKFHDIAYLEAAAICSYEGDITYTNWGMTSDTLEPVNANGQCSKLCSEADCPKERTWKVADCDETLAYLCSYEFKCPEGWIAFDNSCYKLEQTADGKMNIDDGREHCDTKYGSNLMVPNSVDESLFVGQYLRQIQSTVTNNGLTSNQILIGATMSAIKRYIEYQDGSMMTDGKFDTVSWPPYSSYYGASAYGWCFGLQSGGSLFGCSEANVMCERSLVSDKQLCLKKTAVATALTLNETTRIDVDRYMTASMCIQYCRGTGDPESNKYAVVDGSSCVCGKDLAFDSSLPVGSDGDPRVPVGSCKRNGGLGNQMLGDGTTHVAMYNTDPLIKYHGEKSGSRTCYALMKELSLMPEEINEFLLQHDAGYPTVKVNCDQGNHKICRRPLLGFLPASSFSIEGVTTVRRGMEYMQRKSRAQYDSASFSTIVTGENKYWHSARQWLTGCKDEAGCLVVTNTTRLNDKVKIKIKLPNVTRITGIWWSRDYKGSQDAYITKIELVEYTLPPWLGGGKRTINTGYHQLGFSNGGKDARETLFFKQHIVTDKITLYRIHFWADTFDGEVQFDRGYNINFQLDLFGCEEPEVENTYCPDGWYSTGDDCIKVIEADTAINAADAAALCKKSGAKLTEPMNEQIMENIGNAIGNYSGNSTTYWIDLQYKFHSLRGEDEWQFPSTEVFVSNLHYAPWARSHISSDGLCAKIVMEGNETKWSKAICDSTDDNAAICSLPQNWEQIEGCYPLPFEESSTTTYVAADSDPQWRERAVATARNGVCGPQDKFLVLEKNATSVGYTCLKYPLTGLVDEEQCSLPICADGEDPTSGTCRVDDGYNRGYLHRLDDLQCPPVKVDVYTDFAYVWKRHGRNTLSTSTTLRCIHGYQVPSKIFSQPGVEYTLKTMQTQTLTCVIDKNGYANWDYPVTPCEPLTCQYAPPRIPVDAGQEIHVSPNNVTNQQYETNITYFCPGNTSLPDLISDEYTFEYSDAPDVLYHSLNIECEIDGKWSIVGGKFGESCPADVADDQCEELKLPKCVDKNYYCTEPPPIPDGAIWEIHNQPIDWLLTMPETKIQYTCLFDRYAFDYSTDPSLPSFYYTLNINNLTIECNAQGFWEVDYQKDGETCVDKQPDGSCREIFIPECVDRTVYCTELPVLSEAKTTYLEKPNFQKPTQLYTKVEYLCTKENWYFDHSVPDDLISFYYSTNINNITVECNPDGFWTVVNGIDGETCLNGDDSGNELWCKFVNIPDCVDRTILCSDPPLPEALINFVEKPNRDHNYELGTKINYECPDRLHYFSYPVGDNFISYHYTTNVKEIFVECTIDGVWNVTGGVDGLTCQDSNSTDDTLTCEYLTIPDCEDRAVYCVFPPSSINGGTIEIVENTSPTWASGDDSCRWGPWFSIDTPGGKGDIEELEKIVKVHTVKACPEPKDIRARRRLDGAMVNGTHPQKTFMDVSFGFMCRNDKLPFGEYCDDYEVQLCCPGAPENGSSIVLSCTEENWYLDFVDAPFLSSMALDCTNNSTWTTDVTETNLVCLDGSKECVSPAMPHCQDRTIRCYDSLPIPPGFIQTNLTSNTTAFPDALGAVYSYTCEEEGWLIQTEGYPAEMLVECIHPDGWFSDWEYGLWTKGVWSGVGNITECFDPWRCYNDPPDPPLDDTVAWNQTYSRPNYVNTTLNYTCNRQYWVFGTPHIYQGCEGTDEECKEYPKLHTFDRSVNAPSSITLTCTEGKREDGLPDWVWQQDGYEFRDFVPSCFDPTFCDSDPPTPQVDNINYTFPELGSLKYDDGERVYYECANPIYRFPDKTKPKKQWSSEMYVICGWDKTWEPSVVPGCVDPRGCKRPPKRNARVWGSFEDSEEKNLDVHTVYWYQCRDGVFEVQDPETGNVTHLGSIDLICVNDNSGPPPYWEMKGLGRYDPKTNPFPECVKLRKLYITLGSLNMIGNVHNALLG